VPDDSDSSPNPDGKAGPAQRTLGYGIVEYKKLFLDSEVIAVRGVNGEMMWRTKDEKDPYRRRGIEMFAGINGSSESCVLSPEKEAATSGDRTMRVERAPTGDGLKEYVIETRTDGTQVLRDRVFQRLMDSRAGRNQKQAEEGGTCIQDEMHKEQMDAHGRVIGPRLIFELASGVDIQDGIMQCNELLYWDDMKPMCPLLNEPRLYVVESCRNFIWMASNYTALGGEKAGCKDFADLFRYLALGGLRYVSAEMLKTRGGGWSY
jgi:hypothetical protein